MSNNNTSEHLYGMYRGVVLDNKDPAIKTDGKTYGRIKVFIPALMDDEEVGVLAYPGNNPIGGRNSKGISPNKDSNGGEQEFSGTFYIPPNNSYVWIFFENGDPNRPFYSNALDIRTHEAPPEISVNNGAKPEERWLVFRSPHGRTITISDDPDNCRVEITGKKRTSANNSDEHVYDIDGNQKTILIDDRAGKEKILIKDEQGNYVNIRTNMGDIDVHANNTIRLHSGSAVYIDTKYLGINTDGLGVNTNTFETKVGSTYTLSCGSKASIRAGSQIGMDASHISTNEGSAPSSSGMLPDPKNISGERNE